MNTFLEYVSVGKVPETDISFLGRAPVAGGLRLVAEDSNAVLSVGKAM